MEFMKLVHILLHMVNMLGQATWIQLNFNSYLCIRVVINYQKGGELWHRERNMEVRDQLKFEHTSRGSKLINLIDAFEWAFHMFACIAQVFNLNIHACVINDSCKLEMMKWKTSMHRFIHKWYHFQVLPSDIYFK